MFIERMLNQESAPLLEQWLQFTDSRQRLIAEDVVNASTPNYIQKDLSLEKFQEMLRRKVEQRDESAPGSVSFDDITNEIQHPKRGMLFHDGNNRSMEQLMSDQAKNALMHTLAVELLRRQYATLDMALKEKVG